MKMNKTPILIGIIAMWESVKYGLKIMMHKSKKEKGE